jgi:Protein of unknown function (DUF2845)
MLRGFMRHWTLAPLAALMFASSAAHALRCGNSLVKSGAQDFQVRERCGEPFWTDRYSNSEAVGDREYEQIREVQFDVWYYNFGPRQFMRRMVFRDGRLLRDDALGYGYDEVGGNCDRVPDGISAGELLARCGDPARRRSLDDTLIRRPAPGVEIWADQRREEWIYDFGDERFVSIAHLVNGRVTRMELVRR